MNCRRKKKGEGEREGGRKKEIKEVTTKGVYRLLHNYAIKLCS